MRTVYKADRLLCGISVPEFFVTHVGMVQILTPSNVVLTLCQDDGDHLLPVAKVIWPVEKLMEINPELARKCLGLKVA